jgi:transcriptional regulator GlxA family with amidase domain
MATVCTGSLLLAEAGLVSRATIHWNAVGLMRELYPSLEVIENTQWLDESRVITSAGISAGIDMTLHLVERLQGRETAPWTALRMEYEWQS